MAETINTHFPNLEKQLNSIPDRRKIPFYSMADVIFTVISMFLLKTKSRNNLNENRSQDKFKNAFAKIFNYKMPHMDTVHGILEMIDPSHLEAVSVCLVKTLMTHNVLHPFRLLSVYHVVSIDGVKIMNFSAPTEGSTMKISKNGKETYTRSCVQAKITTPNGFSIPIITEWINTDDGATKEDCELNAFKRLTQQLWEYFPRLPICLVFDALYANDSVFSICDVYGWKYIVTLKDKLKTILKKIEAGLVEVIYPTNSLLPGDPEDGGFICDDIKIPNYKNKTIDILHRNLEWLNNLNYKGHVIHWFSCTELAQHPGSKQDRQYFAWITNIKICVKNILLLEKFTRAARAGIEDSFNTEKNRGYAMKHKYARKSFLAGCNYLICMHIAEIINQLITVSRWFQKNLMEQSKSTIRALWEDIIKEITHWNHAKLKAVLNLIPSNYSYQ
ncbi:MAG: hypothetical protein HYZ42_18530 [Bacteroidetes bacterium]|nr:hypothetical protein [Bacteroidota bacterium]